MNTKIRCQGFETTRYSHHDHPLMILKLSMPFVYFSTMIPQLGDHSISINYLTGLVQIQEATIG